MPLPTVITLSVALHGDLDEETGVCGRTAPLSLPPAPCVTRARHAVSVGSTLHEK